MNRASDLAKIQKFGGLVVAPKGGRGLVPVEQSNWSFGSHALLSAMAMLPRGPKARLSYPQKLVTEGLKVGLN
jgi:hypothetical protein